MLTASTKIVHPFHTVTFQSRLKLTVSILLLLHSSTLRYFPMYGKIHTYYSSRDICCDSCYPHTFSFFYLWQNAFLTNMNDDLNCPVSWFATISTSLLILANKNWCCSFSEVYKTFEFPCVGKARAYVTQICVSEVQLSIQSEIWNNKIRTPDQTISYYTDLVSCTQFRSVHSKPVSNLKLGPD